jgi:hypothetical protein
MQKKNILQPALHRCYFLKRCFAGAGLADHQHVIDAIPAERLALSSNIGDHRNNPIRPALEPHPLQ